MSALRPTVAAIDIGGTKVAVGVVAADSTVLAREDLSTAALLADGDPTDGLARVLDRLAAVVAGTGAAVQAVGIGATGRHAVGSGRLGSIGAFLPGWDGLPVVAAAEERFGVPAALENDADASALAEHRHGQRAGASPLVHLTLSTGVGVGTVIDGRLLRGRDGMHPEAGHMAVGGDLPSDVPGVTGEACTCGQPSCWESLAGGRAIVAAWRRDAGLVATAGVAGVPEVVAATDAGDAVAAAVLERAIAATAQGIANLASVFAPSVILIGGGQATLLPRMLPTIATSLSRLRLVLPPEVVAASFGRDTGLIGAAAVGVDAVTRGAVGGAPGAVSLPAAEGVAGTLARVLPLLRGGLVVSCQALPGEALHGAHHMAAMARAAIAGGAVAIRANGPEDIAAIRAAVDVPIVGLEKDDTGAHPVRITPTVAHALRIAAAGADVIALDATSDAGSEEHLRRLIADVHAATGRPVLADVSTVDEALAAVRAGADLVATTLSGYTDRSPATDGPDLVLVAACAAALGVPVLAEGRYRTGPEVAAARRRGAWAVVVGGSVTRPTEIAARLVAELRAVNAGQL